MNVKEMSQTPPNSGPPPATGERSLWATYITPRRDGCHYQKFGGERGGATRGMFEKRCLHANRFRLEAQTVSQILASKRSDCVIGSRFRMQVTDLNEMQNHLRERSMLGLSFSQVYPPIFFCVFPVALFLVTRKLNA